MENTNDLEQAPELSSTEIEARLAAKAPTVEKTTTEQLAEALNAERQEELKNFKEVIDKAMETHPNCEFYFAITLDSQGKSYPQFSVRLKQ